MGSGKSKVTKSILAVLGLLLLACAVFLIPTLWFKPWSIDHFYTRVFGQFALHHPMMLSSLRLLEPMGLRLPQRRSRRHVDRLRPREAECAEGQLEILHSYDRDSMSPEEALSYDILEWFMLDGRARPTAGCSTTTRWTSSAACRPTCRTS